MDTHTFSDSQRPKLKLCRPGGAQGQDTRPLTNSLLRTFCAGGRYPPDGTASGFSLCSADGLTWLSQLAADTGFSPGSLLLPAFVGGWNRRASTYRSNTYSAEGASFANCVFLRTDYDKQYTDSGADPAPECSQQAPASHFIDSLERAAKDVRWCGVLFHDSPSLLKTWDEMAPARFLIPTLFCASMVLLPPDASCCLMQDK